jgi:hypothetical protein
MVADPQAQLVVITDANILINFLHIGQLPLLGKLTAYRFVVPHEVIAEIEAPVHAADLAKAIAEGHLAAALIDSPTALALFAELEGRLLRTEHLILCAIREGHLTVEKADEFKAVLAARRYVMAFSSFSDCL